MLRKLPLFLVALCFLLTSCYQPAAFGPDEDTSEKVAPSFIDMGTVRHLFCGDYTGTGVIISTEKVNLVLTAAHVVAKRETCFDFDTGEVGTVASRDADTDIALIVFPKGKMPERHIDISCDGFTKDNVYFSVGWQLGQMLVINTLSATGETVPYLPVLNFGFYRGMALLHGAIVPGMSGGPIVDINGKMVGMNNVTDWNGKNSLGSNAFSRQMKDTFLCKPKK